MLKTYKDKTFGKTLFVCKDGCSTGSFENLVKEQCENNVTKECNFLVHNSNCICNKLGGK